MTPLTALSPQQRAVLAFIRRFLSEHGLPPTRGEIATGLALKNRQGIDQHLRALQTKGALELLPGVSRGIRLLDEPEGTAEPASTAAMSMIAPPSLPLLGRIAAGAPILASAHVEEHISIEPGLFKPRASFLLRVRGDSMKDADILDQDLLAVHQTQQVRNGQIVVARVAGSGGDEATVKYYRRRGSLVMLEPANPAYQPLEIDLRRQSLSIEGIAVGVVRTTLSRRP